MGTRKNFYDALNKVQPEKCPYNVLCTVPAHEKMQAYYNDEHFDEKIGNCFQFINLDGFDQVKELEPDIVEDYFGVVWNRKVDKDIGVEVGHQITDDTIDDYVFPDPYSDVLFGGLEQKIIDAKAKDRVVVGNYGFSLFERAWTLYGMENLLMAMMVDKDLANKLFDRILEYNLKLITKACTYDIDGMRFGDDWGMQKGLIMGPELWREFIKPRIREMYKIVKDSGKFVMIHSCGQVTELFPDLIEVGVDIFNPFQPEVMDVAEVKRLYGDRLSFYGGISLQKVLTFGTPDEVRAETRRMIDLMGKGGGYIASPSHDITGDVSAENIATMIEVMQNQ